MTRLTERELAKILRVNGDITLEVFDATPTPQARRNVPITITLPNERADGWNKVMRANRYAQHKVATAMWERVRPGMPAAYALYTCRVDIHVVATFKGNSLDSDNVASKLWIDTLKGKLIVDDKPEWVRRVTTEAKKGKVNSVVIVLTPVVGAE